MQGLAGERSCPGLHTGRRGQEPLGEGSRTLHTVPSLEGCADWGMEAGSPEGMPSHRTALLWQPCAQCCGWGVATGRGLRAVSSACQVCLCHHPHGCLLVHRSHPSGCHLPPACLALPTL